MRVAGEVDGRVDVVALGAVVGAADQEFELWVGFGVVDYFFEFGEGGGVDDGADEVFKVYGGADFQGAGFGDEDGFDLGPEGGGDVGAGGGAAFLTLVFKGAADGVDGRVVRVRAVVDEVEVLPARFADDARVASVFALGDVGGDLAVEAAEDGRAACVVKAGEIAVGEGDGCHFDCVTRDELDHVGWETGFEEDLVNDVV